MKRNIAAFMLVLALMLSFTCGAEDDDTIQYMENEWNFVENAMDISQGIPEDVTGVLGAIRDSGVLRVGTEPYFAPQEFIDPALSGQEQYVGSDMEMARRVAERMGVELEIIPMEFTHVLDAVSDGECDLVISALSYTPERAAKVTLSKGYHYTDAGVNIGLIIRTGDDQRIQGLDDLEGLDIVAQSGSLQESMAAQHITNYRQFNRPKTVQELYDAVAGGTADAGVVDLESAQAYIDSKPDCGLMLVEDARLTLEPQFDGDRVAAAKGELALMYFVNGVIDELLADGQYRKWFDEYAEYAARLGL